MNKPTFRAWWIKEKEMHEVSILDFRHEQVHFIGADSVDFSEIILMQSTGLKGKNGVEIFEGDCIKTVSGNIQVVVFVVGSKTRNQDSRIAQFSCYDKRGYFHFDVNDEVVGNIHANPELLNEVSG